MKITVLTIGTRGDVQPFVALGIGLKQVGYEVEIVTHEIFKSWIRSYGFDFTAIEGNPQEFIALEEGQRILASGKNPLEFIRLFAESINPFVNSLMSDIWRICQSTDLIVAHSILFWTYDLAQRLEVPYFLASFTPLTPTTKYPNDGSPPVYVGFGSMSDRNPQATTEIVLAAKLRLLQFHQWT